ncbi:MAG TPA: helix-turn-helix domain-containing protein [Bryobacteraceae bacterium]|nr:helix-turn-helix domain-containing protein [Bryobacteraceae bacterium]
MPKSTSRSNRQRGAEGKPIHFSIGKVARILKVSTSTLRKWERLGITVPERSPSGYRRFSHLEVERLKKVQKLKTEKHVSSTAVVHLLEHEESRTDGPKAPEIPSIAHRLKRLREQMGWTASEAAERAGISVSYLSNIERGHANASVAILQKLATIYNTNVLSFFGEVLPAQKLVRPNERRRLVTDPGVTIELLALGQCTMEPHLFRVSPGATSGGSYTHDGEEFIFMMGGTLDIWLDEVEHYQLSTGDSLYFSSRQAHRWMNAGQEEAVMLWCGSVLF